MRRLPGRGICVPTHRKADSGGLSPGYVAWMLAIDRAIAWLAVLEFEVLASPPFVRPTPACPLAAC